MILLFCLLLPSFSAHAAIEDPWKKADEDGALSIFERKEEGLLAFRTEGVVDAPMKAVAATILDSSRTPEWVDHLEEDRVLRRPKPNQYIEYTHVGTPFVLKDRDFLCEVNVLVDEAKKELVIESHSIDDPSFPATKHVRGWVRHNEFRLSPAGPGRTKLVGEFHIDPKGSVAKWVVNLFQRAWPKKAFRAIQKRVAEVKPELPPELEPVLAPVAGF